MLRKDAQMVGLKVCLIVAWKDVPKVAQWVLQMEHWEPVSGSHLEVLSLEDGTLAAVMVMQMACGWAAEKSMVDLLVAPMVDPMVDLLAVRMADRWGRV